MIKIGINKYYINEIVLFNETKDSNEMYTEYITMTPTKDSTTLFNDRWYKELILYTSVRNALKFVYITKGCLLQCINKRVDNNEQM